MSNKLESSDEITAAMAAREFKKIGINASGDVHSQLVAKYAKKETNKQIVKRLTKIAMDSVRQDMGIVKKDD